MTRKRSWISQLGGLAIFEERRLAGIMAGALYLVGAGTAMTLLLLPHVPRGHWPVVVACAGFGLVTRKRFSGLWAVVTLVGETNSPITSPAG